MVDVSLTEIKSSTLVSCQLKANIVTNLTVGYELAISDRSRMEYYNSIEIVYI